MESNATISYNKLRQTIGLLGIALPVLIYLHLLFVSHYGVLQDSISHYYYTVSNVWFIGILWGLGLVLIFYPAYKNESKKDTLLTTISGICALCVSLFPTNANSNDACAIFTYDNSPWRAGFHYACAAGMLLIFSYMSIKIFTKTTIGNDLTLDVNLWKRKRNRVFKVCGWMTMLSVACIGIITLLELKWTNMPITTKYTFWLEVTALVPFGIAWLIKGGFALTDTNEESTLEGMKNLMLSKQKEIKSM
jgi:hypothetical protein